MNTTALETVDRDESLEIRQPLERIVALGKELSELIEVGLCNVGPLADRERALLQELEEADARIDRVDAASTEFARHASSAKQRSLNIDEIQAISVELIRRAVGDSDNGVLPYVRAAFGKLKKLLGSKPRPADIAEISESVRERLNTEVLLMRAQRAELFHDLLKAQSDLIAERNARRHLARGLFENAMVTHHERALADARQIKILQHGPRRGRVPISHRYRVPVGVPLLGPVRDSLSEQLSTLQRNRQYHQMLAGHLEGLLGFNPLAFPGGNGR